MNVYISDMAVRLARMAELPVSLEEIEDEGSRGFLECYSDLEISAEDVEVQMDEPEDGDQSEDFESEEIQFQVSQEIRFVLPLWEEL